MRLRHRIEIQRDTPTQDATGQPVSVWLTIRKCWANVEDLESRGGETNLAAKVAAVATTEVTILYPQDDPMPDARDRVVYVEGNITRTLNIESIHRLDGNRRMLQLVCSEDQDG